MFYLHGIILSVIFNTIIIVIPVPWLSVVIIKLLDDILNRGVSIGLDVDDVIITDIWIPLNSSLLGGIRHDHIVATLYEQT